ncbi:MAG: ABC transporter ATP-binding protein [Longimicrobiales bacterium]
MMATKVSERIRGLSPVPLLRGLRLVWDSAAGWTAAQLVLLVIQGLFPLATLYLMKLIVDAVTGAASAGSPVDFQPILILIAIAGGVALASAMLRVLTTLVGEVQSLRVTDRVHDTLHAKSIQIDLSYYENSEYHDTLHRAQMEAPYRPTRIVNGIALVVQSGISLIAVMSLILSFHWVGALVLFAAGIPGMLVRIRYSSRMYRLQRHQTSTQRRTRYFNALLTTEPYAKEMRLFGLGDLFRGRFRELAQRVRQEKLQLVARRSILEFAAQIFAVAAVFGIFIVVARRAVAGDITIGDMVMYFGAFQRAQDFLREFLGGLAALYDDNLFLTDLNTFLTLEPNVQEPAQPVAFPSAVRKGIRVDHLRFRYPGSSRVVLDDISLEVRAGEHIALVGENGSGKTTLVKLLCRLYDPEAGSIRVDGVDLRDMETQALRREISVVFQDYARYHLTARENVWLGNVGLPLDSTLIERAAAQTGADRVIERLPQQWATILGKQFDQGMDLSIGEWQKVALARAFLRDSQIIVLDEPTASLDARSEAEVFERFHELAYGRTAILISHRLSTVRMVDRIIVMSGGRIVESGAHDDLVVKGGRYAELFELQARYYR